MRKHFTIASFVGGHPVGQRTVAEETEAKTLARIIYTDLCKTPYRGSVRVVVYPVIDGSPQNVIVIIDEEAEAQQ